VFEDKHESFQCDVAFSSFEINQLVKVLLLEVQKYYSWDIEKCRSSPLYCVAKLFKGSITMKNLRMFLKTRIILKNFVLSLQNFSTLKPISYKRAVSYGVPFKGRGMSCRETEPPSDIQYGAEKSKNQKHCLNWWDKKGVQFLV
jgi:hypothetical protein